MSPVEPWAPPARSSTAAAARRLPSPQCLSLHAPVSFISTWMRSATANSLAFSVNWTIGSIARLTSADLGGLSTEIAVDGLCCSLVAGLNVNMKQVLGGVILAKVLQQYVKGKAMAPWLVFCLIGLWWVHTDPCHAAGYHMSSGCWSWMPDTSRSWSRTWLQMFACGCVHIASATWTQL